MQRDRRHPLPLVAEVPLPLLEVVARPPPKEDRDEECQVQADDRHRDHCVERSRHDDRRLLRADVDLDQGREGDDDGHDGSQDHGLHGHLVLGQARPPLGAGDGTVTAERVGHARRARHACHRAEELADGRDHQHHAGPLGVQGLGEDDGHAATAGGDRLGVLHCVQEGEQQDPAADGRVEDRLPDALRGAVGCSLGLLGEVGRGVEAGDRVLREQEAQGQDDEPEARGPPSSPCRAHRCC